MHRAFDRSADLLLAGLIGVVMKQPAFDEAAHQSRADYRFPLERGRPRTLQVRLLGGLLIWVTSLYCGPLGNWRGRPFANTGEFVLAMLVRTTAMWYLYLIGSSLVQAYMLFIFVNFRIPPP